MITYYSIIQCLNVAKNMIFYQYTTLDYIKIHQVR